MRTPPNTILPLVLFPLTFGALIGWAVVNSWLTAYEDAQRERVTRDTEN